MRRRQHSRGGAGVVPHIALVKPLCHTAMREQHRFAVAMRRQQIGVVDVEARGHGDQAAAATLSFLPNRYSPFQGFRRRRLRLICGESGCMGGLYAWRGLNGPDAARYAPQKGSETP